MPHHRSPEFKALLARDAGRLKRVFAPSNDVLLFTGSGTGAFESAFANLVSPGDRVLVVSAGNFGERWVKMVAAYGADVGAGEQPGASRPDPARGRAARPTAGLRRRVRHPSETSTGVVHDIQAIAERYARAAPLLVVDAVSSLGGAELETDAWGIDVVVSGSQKALMSPARPGVRVGLRAGAGSWRERRPAPRF